MVSTVQQTMYSLTPQQRPPREHYIVCVIVCPVECVQYIMCFNSGVMGKSNWFKSVLPLNKLETWTINSLSLQWLHHGETIQWWRLSYANKDGESVFISWCLLYLSRSHSSSCIEVTCGLICFRGYVMGMQINAPGSACAFTQACSTAPSILLAILLHN